ncbi:sulfite oxidase [Salinarimonas sp. NSM]|uniref:sulfite oxidase n=1 Tax=Salinarimonas sp. NSM TaxID=3458003 RepID=UPI004034FBE0
MKVIPEVADLRAAKPGLKILPDGALNAEPPLSLLCGERTPISAFFVRNNGDTPHVADPSRWTIDVDGCVEAPARFTLDELRQRFEVVSLTAVLECAGNTRSGFDPPTDGLPWGRGAVGCARWTGVRLADVLLACGVRPEAHYTGHHAPDRTSGGGPALSRGLPIAKALAPETLLAFAMNDAPLTPLHGAPLRIVAPGMPGSAWQKWLARVEVRDRVHDGAKMNGTDYRLPRRPHRPGEPADPTEFDVIESMPVNAMITAPLAGARVRAGETLRVQGFAWSGDAPVTEVTIHVAGEPPLRATLAPQPERWAWRAFETEVVVPAQPRLVLTACARDASGRSQPMGGAAWNPRGYCNNTPHEVVVEVVA